MTVTVVISVVGLVVAAAGTSYSVYIGKRNSALSAESVRLAGEQEALRRAVQTQVVDRLLAVYETVHEFNQYIWLVYKNQDPLDAAFVHDFYMARFADLTAIRTSPAYARFKQVLSSMGETPTVTAVDVRDATRSAVTMAPVAERLGIFEGAPIRDLFTDFESSFWRNLLHTAQKISRAANSSEVVAPDPARPSWIAELDEKDARGTAAVMKSSLFEMQRLAVYLVLLKKYAPMIALELDRRFGAIVP